jgi:type 2A phosphatase activator TIP41
MSESLGLPTLPEMVYVNNWIKITHIPTDSVISMPSNILSLQFLHSKLVPGFEPRPALASSIDSDLRRVQCAAASNWSSKADKSSRHVHEYDWTFSPSYTGTLTAIGQPWEPVQDSDSLIDVGLLKKQDPILWFDHVLLFEDELHDHGVSSLYVIRDLVRESVLNSGFRSRFG